MSSRNLVILVGHVGQDPESKFMESGDQVANFSLATSEKWKDKSGEQQTKTEWHNIVTWKHQAKFVADYVKKGDPLYIEGKIQTRSFEDKNGEKRFITEINARSVQSLAPKRD
jgi:single-strand DNA-binding protein